VDQSSIVQNSIIAVLTIDDIQTAIPAARALLKGGVRSIELTLRTNEAFESLQVIKTNFPEMTVGAGTIIFPDQVKRVLDAGADFGVSPGFQALVAEEALKLKLPFAPGIATPSDIEAAVSLGFRVLKFYPAEPMGGLNYLRSMSTPYQHLGLRFVPLGGINIDNMHKYLADKLIPSIGGSWIANRKLIQAKDWESITVNARKALKLANIQTKDE
jgi:2-dehydro-3-deoxyphosphogluconate aldolase/(4S)-4-hydroxy-2-oxoglutarate aldolase